MPVKALDATYVMQLPQVLPCSDPSSTCAPDTSSAQPDGPLDSEKADMVAGMMHLVTATAGRCGGPGSHGTQAGDGGSFGAQQSDHNDHSPDSRSEQAGETGADGECPNPDGQTDLASFDALEQQAAGTRFVQVADAKAAAAYGTQWRCQAYAKTTDGSKGLRAGPTLVRVAAKALHRFALALRRRTAVPAALLLRTVKRSFSLAAVWLPAPVLTGVATISKSVFGSARGQASIADKRTDEWWKHNPAGRASLLTLHGWQGLSNETLTRLPSLQAVLLTLSRAVPGFSEAVLLFHRQEALCASHPPPADPPLLQ